MSQCSVSKDCGKEQNEEEPKIEEKQKHISDLMSKYILQGVAAGGGKVGGKMRKHINPVTSTNSHKYPFPPLN